MGRYDLKDVLALTDKKKMKERMKEKSERRRQKKGEQDRGGREDKLS